jgi:hypothetical protein
VTLGTLTAINDSRAVLNGKGLVKAGDTQLDLSDLEATSGSGIDLGAVMATTQSEVKLIAATGMTVKDVSLDASKFGATATGGTMTLNLLTTKNLSTVTLTAGLGITVKDPSSGYRLFTRSALGKIIPDLSARDPFIVTEVLYAAKRHGLKVVECPIEFLSRAAGQSKLRPATLFKYLLRVWKFRFSAPRNA